MIAVMYGKERLIAERRSGRLEYAKQRQGQHADWLFDKPEAGYCNRYTGRRGHLTAEFFDCIRHYFC